MINKIEESKAFQNLENHAQQLVRKRANRIQIEDAIIQTRNIGLKAWKEQTALPLKWQKIVEEISLK